jgi:hypothetical protein
MSIEQIQTLYHYAKAYLKIFVFHNRNIAYSTLMNCRVKNKGNALIYWCFVGKEISLFNARHLFRNKLAVKTQIVNLMTLSINRKLLQPCLMFVLIKLSIVIQYNRLILVNRLLLIKTVWIYIIANWILMKAKT